MVCATWCTNTPLLRQSIRLQDPDHLTVLHHIKTYYSRIAYMYLHIALNCVTFVCLYTSMPIEPLKLVVLKVYGYLIKSTFFRAEKRH